MTTNREAGPPNDTGAGPFHVPSNRWRADAAGGKTPAELLLYRSSLLGSDLAITNFGGGNTSAKLDGIDPLTRQPARVLWVKGSGGDLGSMHLDGFSTLYLDKLLGLEHLYRGADHEDEMVDYLPHCTFNINPRAASIDTPLHAYLPFTHVDHVHPDAIIAIATAADGEATVRKIWGGAVGWLPWQRPGFDLGLRLRDHVRTHPGLRGLVLGGHGLICWANDARSCYDNTIGLITDAVRHLNGQLAGKPVFGGPAMTPRPEAERHAVAAHLMPVLRSMVSGARPMLGHFTDDASTLEFVCSRECGPLAAAGTACPDHFLRTKVTPLVLNPERLMDEEYLAAQLEAYRQQYRAYHARCADSNDPPIRDANPVVILIPGIGRLSFASDPTTARVASEFYGNAINVMRGAGALGGYRGLDAREAFRIEYWSLEEAKLRRLPPPKPLAGRIALVTGAAGGIGAACARRLLAAGACLMVTDLAPAELENVRSELSGTYGRDFVRAAVCDVTDESQVQAAFEQCAVEFGGLDILVANAGLASAAPIEQTTVALWRKNHDVLAEGYFLASRAAFPLMRRQGRGSIIFIGSKNALAATPNASAYASAKAAALHLARCLAVEGAADSIRVNIVNPDAVIRGSGIWNGDWRSQRASAHGIDPGTELEEFYRMRSMLKLNVLPEDVAEAAYFFASDASAKSTANILNVDAGNSAAFPR
ncbi:MAG: bifunctional rhamnulose-1-phosphate aldolase/short-chain dehydrogenase [Proteobacteria bacterium]|nr:bifunctional rhamnulose-1-phosphate aldolase/short-chain dehydrogenase [Pseudomonadota bacterium]